MAKPFLSWVVGKKGCWLLIRTPFCFKKMKFHLTSTKKKKILVYTFLCHQPDFFPVSSIKVITGPAITITFVLPWQKAEMIQGFNSVIYYQPCTHYFLPLLELCVHFLTRSYFHINFTLVVSPEFEYLQNTFYFPSGYQQKGCDIISYQYISGHSDN